MCLFKPVKEGVAIAFLGLHVFKYVQHVFTDLGRCDGPWGSFFQKVSAVHTYHLIVLTGKITTRHDLASQYCLDLSNSCHSAAPQRCFVFHQMQLSLGWGGSEKREREIAAESDILSRRTAAVN